MTNPNKLADAIAKAQQPCAQATGIVCGYPYYDKHGARNVVVELNDDGAEVPDGARVYLHPQPPSIPEPSEADVDAAVLAFDGEGHWECFERVIRNDRARLRERIGGRA